LIAFKPLGLAKLRPLLGVAIAYIATVALGNMVLIFVTPRIIDGPLIHEPYWSLQILLVRGVAAATGGFLAASIAKPDRLKVALIFASVLVIVELIQSYEQWGNEQLSLLLKLGLPVAVGIAATLGGWLRAGRPSTLHGNRAS